MDWDSLRIVLAVARAGSLSGAARALGVNHSTVFRRLGAIEAELEVRLFERLPGGFLPTAPGEALRVAAGRVEAEVLAAERRLRGQDLRLTGSLRVTAPDTVALKLLPEALAAFRRACPGIDVELSVDNGLADLTRREADVALRPTERPPEALVGRRIAAIAFAVYGAPGYLEATAARPLAEHDWIAPDDSLRRLAIARWLRESLPEAQVVLRSDSLMGLFEAARAGLGLATLPCFMADPEPGLRRVEGPLAGTETALWLLTHADLRRTARIRAFLDVVGPWLVARRDLLEGRGSDQAA